MGRNGFRCWGLLTARLMYRDYNNDLAVASVAVSGLRARRRTEATIHLDGSRKDSIAAAAYTRRWDV